MKRRNFLNNVALASILLACNKKYILPKENSAQYSERNDLMISADYLHFNSYGQSLAVGGTNNQPSSVVSVIQKYDSVMPDLGVRSWDYMGSTATSFVPLIEKLSPNGVMGETLCSGCCEMFNQAMPNRIFRLHATASGQSSKSVLELSKGSTIYQRLLRDIKTAKNIAGKEGKTFSVGAIGWTQGEKDYAENTSYSDYKLRLKELNAAINNDVAQITLQSLKIHFIVGQISSQNRDLDSMANPNIALAQLDLCINNPNFTLATPIYMLDFLADNTHLDSVNYRILASYYGYAMKRLLIDDVKNFIYPKNHRLENNILYIKFNVPVKPLVFDTVQVVNPGNFGFSVKDAIGNEILINKVDIIEGNIVRIICENSPSIVTYAINGKSKKAGRLEGPRGCLRDSQGNNIIFDPQGTSWKLHNWAPIFKLKI